MQASDMAQQDEEEVQPANDPAALSGVANEKKDDDNGACEANKKNSNSNSKDSKETTIHCYACGDELKNDHHGIKCCNDHHLCPGDCSQNFIRNAIIEPHYPVIPPMCLFGGSHEVLLQTIERNMKEDDYLQWQKIQSNHVRYQKLCMGEELVECPFCHYAEFHISGAGFNQLFCKNDACKKTSCKYCHEEMWMPDDRQKQELSEENFMRWMQSQEQHSLCGTLGPCREAIMTALHRGMNSTCPGCGQVGRKNDQCTHMTCFVCHTRYCYICEEILPESMFTHNDIWAYTPDQCPLYMRYLHESDHRYPPDDAEALNVFHRLKTIGLLQVAIKDMGEKQFDMVLERFGQVRNCGFSKNEIFSTDATLIVTDDRPSTFKTEF